MRTAAVFALGVMISVGVFAQGKPFQASLTPDIAIHEKDVFIEGLTLSIWGENPQTSLALGLVNGSTGDSKGFQLALGCNYSDSFTGVQWAAVNYTKGEVLGWQGAFVNYAEGDMTGLQTAYVNYAGNLKGVQFGLVNWADTVETGVQIGILNIIPETTTWFQDFPDAVAPGMIFLNWRF